MSIFLSRLFIMVKHEIITVNRKILFSHRLNI